MNQNDLYLKYAEIIKMCQGTALEDTPWLGVRFNGSEFYDHPRFDTLAKNYQFAVAILEDRPVFPGDILCFKPSGSEYVASKHTTASAVSDMTWQPPKPKRTFMLNGVELPCPARGGESTFLIGTCARALMGYRFGTHEDRDRVLHEIERILDEAGNKP